MKYSNLLCVNAMPKRRNYRVKILMLIGEASYHTMYDYATAKVLEKISLKSPHG